MSIPEPSGSKNLAPVKRESMTGKLYQCSAIGPYDAMQSSAENRHALGMHLTNAIGVAS